jgi:hypothetical protein
MIQIPMKKLLLFITIITLAGCATLGGPSKIACTPEVRKQSRAGDAVFDSLLTDSKGIRAADVAAFPEAKERTLVKIEVIFPYDSKRMGSEHWTIRHDTDKTAVYQVTLVPNEEQDTDYTVTLVK